jgi:P27 family predicted phage terminase small subunit
MVEGATVAYASYRAAQEIIEREGMMVEDDKGNPKAHPMIQVRDRSLKLFMDFSARLGLSPADRARLGLNISALAKTAGQLMEERYGDDDSGEVEVVSVKDAGMEPDTLREVELGYDSYDEA